MSRLINTTTMTVDAVTDVAEWFVSEGGHDDAAREQFDGTAGMLMGRKTYEGLAAYWPEQSGTWGDLLNPMPKFVASRTLQGSLAGTRRRSKATRRRASRGSKTSSRVTCS